MKQKKTYHVNPKRMILFAVLVVIVLFIGSYILKEARQGTFGSGIRVSAWNLSARWEDMVSSKEPIYFAEEDAGDTAILIYDTENKTRVFSNREEQPFVPASLTKLITAIVALEELSADEIVHVTEEELELVKAGGSTANLVPGDYTVRDLLEAMLIASANDAAYILAAGAGKKLESCEISSAEAVVMFVEQMNVWLEKNKYLNTKVTDPAGDTEEDQSTLQDLLGITLQALAVSEIDQAVRKNEMTIHPGHGDAIHLKTTNFLMDPTHLNYNPRVTGVKTGSMEGLANLILRYERKGYAYVCIILGETSYRERNNAALRFIYAADHVQGTGPFDRFAEEIFSVIRSFTER